MEVLTLVGGFRGLGDISAAQRTQLLTTLNNGLVDADAVIQRVRAASAAGQIPRDVGVHFNTLYQIISDRAVILQQQLDEAEPVVTEWTAQMQLLLRDAGAFVNSARSALGELTASRGLQLALIAAASVTLLGGAAWVLYRWSKRRGGGRRGRGRSRTRRSRGRRRRR